MTMAVSWARATAGTRQTRIRTVARMSGALVGGANGTCMGRAAPRGPPARARCRARRPAPAVARHRRSVVPAAPGGWVGGPRDAVPAGVLLPPAVAAGEWAAAAR